MGDDDKVKKKKKKPKPPKLPGKPPPNDDKAATDKYNEATKFLDCTGTKVVLKAGKLDWIDFGWITPEATFEADKAKPGTINIKVKLPTGDISLPATVKDGKLDIDTKDLPLGKDKVKEFVDGLNAWFGANGKQLDGPAVKDGELTLTKSAVAAPGKADEKKDEKKGIKGGLFPHVPVPEKAAAAGLLGLSVLFGVGFMNAGDETETRTEKVCPEAGGPGESVGAGIDCPEGPVDAPEPAPAQGLAQLVRVVTITPEGGDPAAGIVEPSNEQNQIFLELPLFRIGERDTVELLDKREVVLDSFTFTVPAKQGLSPPVTSERGGMVLCLIDHENPMPPGNSGADCQYTEPVADAVPPPTPDDSEPVVPESREVEENTEGKPWSLLAIPGAVLGLAGGLALEEERRRREEPNLGGFDPTSGTYPDWETTTYPDWQETGAAEDVPPPPPPPSTPDVM